MINEIWEGLRLLLFFSSPKRGFYGGKRGFRILATRRPTPGQGWPLLLLRTSRRPCRQAAGRKARRPAVPPRRPTPGHTMAPASAVSPRRPCRQAGPHGPPRRPGPGLSPLGVSLAAALWPSSGPKGMRRHENCPACPGRPPPGSGPRGWWLSGPGGVGPGPPWAVAGLPRSVFAAARSAGGAAPPARLKAVLGAGPGSTAGRPPCGLAVPPVAAVWSLGAFLPPRVGRAALGLPWPVPAWGAVIGWPGAPQRPGGRDGRGPLSGARAVVLFGLVPCRRRSGPRFSGRAGQR